jgi:IS30 family transposase
MRDVAASRIGLVLMNVLLTPFKDLVLTITADKGKEFAYHERIARALDAEVSFADPYSS